MTPFPRRYVAVAFALILLAVPGHAQTAIINKARAYLGTEAALDGVRSVHYKGRFVETDPADPSKETRATIDIIFQKPEQQRIVLTTDKAVHTTGLSGYEAWQRIEDATNPAKWKQTVASPAQIKGMRANTWENVSFYRGIETRGGRLEALGQATVDGIACQKVAFIHGPKSVFIRYFDEATGKLVLTETESGATIREEGEQIVDGIRFPKRIITKTKNAAGKESVITTEFDEIKLNETFPPSVFNVPGLERK